ncbi:hypothetical protein Taro_018038 [Colocasia esculenta]|uniref:Uncharacterized protein n=1 Tax=Colocasia esculenta TaxID=4460 RepID=A0A843UPV9_COLES|nr:hypothetical protein [Colocasia esculenta]
MVGRGSLGETRAFRISLLKGERKSRSSSAGAFPSAHWTIASTRRSRSTTRRRHLASSCSELAEPSRADPWEFAATTERGGRGAATERRGERPRHSLTAPFASSPDANGAVSPPAHPEAPGGREIIGATIPLAVLVAEKPPELVVQPTGPAGLGRCPSTAASVPGVQPFPGQLLARRPLAQGRRCWRLRGRC